MAIYVLLPLFISLLLAWLTIPNIVIISKQKRLFDVPNARKVHEKAIPRLGGVSFFPGILVSFCLTLGLRYIMGNALNVGYEDAFIAEFMIFSAGLISLFFVGLADDLVGVGYKGKFVVQILASLMLVSGGIYMKSFYGLFGIWDIPATVGIPITICLVVLIVNAFNLIDGVDGLCSGLSSIASATLCGWFWYNGIPVYAALGMGMLGTLIVFFMYNVTGSRLKVFMGDSGSLMLGFIISFLGLKFSDLNRCGLFDTPNAPILVMSMIFIPIFDTVRVFTQRILAGKSPFYPDKSHIHHLMLRLGFSHLQSTGIILMAAIFFIILNFLLQNIDINILFAVDILSGLFFLCWLPQHLVKRRETKREKYKN